MTQQNYYQTQDEAGLAGAMEAMRKEMAGGGKIRSMGCKGWETQDKSRNHPRSNTGDRVLGYMQDTTGWVTTKAVAEHVQITTSTANGVLARLTGKGKLHSKMDRNEANHLIRFWKYRGEK